MKTIGFLISTMYGDYPNWIYFKELQGYRIWIIDQCDSIDTVELRNIKIIKTTERGLSNSRNMGMDIITSDYILFVDNDNEIDLVELKKLEKFIMDASNSFDAIINSSNLHPFKFSAAPRRAKFHEIFGAASWQLCINKRLAKLHRFDARFGLGASPMKANHGEENIFLSDIFFAGGKIMKTPFSVFSHDDLGTGARIQKGFWRSKYNIYTRATNPIFGGLLVCQKFIRLLVKKWIQKLSS